MSKNTGIRIEAVKEVNDNGEQGYRITKIQALADKDLPKMYCNGERPIAILGTGWTDPDNRLFLFDGEKEKCIAGWNYAWCRFYTAEDMEKINGHIKAAGQHLADVNAHLAKERDTWNGKVVFVDGKETQYARKVRAWEPWLKSTETVPSESSEDIPIPLAERIAELWGEGRLLYRNKKGHIKPLKPLA